MEVESKKPVPRITIRYCCHKCGAVPLQY